MCTRNTQRYNGGQAFILTILMLILTSSGIVSAMLFPTIKDFAAARESSLGTKSYFLAESLLEDLTYRMREGIDTDATESLTIDGETAQAVITSEGPFGELLTITGDVDGRIRRIQASLNVGDGATFNYGVQTGNGGFYLSNNAGVNGNVYSNGNIVGSNGAFIKGTAIAANTSALASDQANTTPLPPTQDMIFASSSIREDIAQSFQVSTTSPVNKIQVYIKKVGTPSNFTARIVTDNNGSPSGTTLTSVTVNASQVTGSYGWIEAVFPSNPLLTEGTTYWLVLDATYSATKYYVVGGNTGYASGGGKIGKQGGTWYGTIPSGQDLYFNVYVGGLTSTISGVIVGQGGVGTAHAHTVNNSTVASTLYCQTGSGNNKPCNTSLPDPSPIGYPISEANIAEWKQAAEDGTVINGNYTVSASSTVMGPVKINGNLTVTNNAQITMMGNIWVTGNILTYNNTVIRLDPSYGHNSGVLIADGRIDISNNATFQGTGQSGSYVLVLSTSACPDTGSCSGMPAINVSNNTGGALLNAQKGTVYIANNVNIKEITGYKIVISNNTTVTYELGLANVNFISGPSGSFGITGWREIQ